mmetsp:Transcript_4192/g.12604  ORF Transcript_4192/g.12604 Transcript_4192/m.12604 type:complete len:271 (-) Transcript_4192:263-1075(-)
MPAEHPNPGLLVSLSADFVRTHKRVTTAKDDPDLGRRRVMSVFHTWRLGTRMTGLSIVFCIDHELTCHLFDLSLCNRTRPQYCERLRGRVKNRGLKPHGNRAAVQNTVELSAQVCQNVLCRGWGWLSGGVCRRRGDGQSDRGQKCRRHRVFWNPHGHCIQTCSDQAGDIGTLPQAHDQSDWSWPEFLCHARCRLREGFGKAGFVQCLDRGHVHDERIVCRSTLCPKDPLDRGVVCGIRSQPVHRLRRECHDLTMPQCCCGMRNIHLTASI